MTSRRTMAVVVAVTIAILVATIAMWFLLAADTLSLIAKIVLGVLTTGIALFALYDETMGKKMSRAGTLSLIAMVLVWTVVGIFADTKDADSDQLELTSDLVTIMSNLNSLETQMIQIEQSCANPTAMKPIAQKRREVQTQLDENLERLRQGIAKRRR
jgi:hypothetical protein